MISTEDICDPLHGFSRRKGTASLRDHFFLRRASRCSLSHRLLSMFISVTSIVSPDVPLAEVFIGTMSGWGSDYKSVLQALVLVRRVVPANHRISSLRQDVVESVLFSDRSGCTPADSEESPPRTWIRCRRGVACGLSPKSEGFWSPHAVLGLRMTNLGSIGADSQNTVSTSSTEPGPSFVALRIMLRASRNIILLLPSTENYQRRLSRVDKNFKCRSISFACRRCD